MSFELIVTRALEPMPKILISYRRADSAAVVGRIFDRLISYYGEESVSMDIDNIPFGIDFRTQILEILRRTDVVLAVIGPNWVGTDANGRTRINEPTDPVRLEIETALAQRTPIIPILVDGAKMPAKNAVPDEFGDFVYLNAADVATGRDFRTHVDRLIEAIDRRMSDNKKVVAPRRPSGRAQDKTSAKRGWLNHALLYLVVPLILLVVAHHLIVNAFDLKIEYLWAAAAIIPSVSGFLFFWMTGSGAGAAFGFAIALGIIAVAGMDMSQNLNSGDPIIPQNGYEWRDNIQFAVGIAFSYFVGHAVVRALRVVKEQKYLIGPICLALAPPAIALLVQVELERGSQLLVDPKLSGMPRAHATELTSLAFTSDTLVTSSYDGTIKFWDKGNLSRTVSVPPQSTGITSAPLIFAVSTPSTTPKSPTSMPASIITAITPAGIASDDGKGGLPIVAPTPVATSPQPADPIALGAAVAHATLTPYTVARNWFAFVNGTAPFAALSIPHPEATALTDAYVVGDANGRITLVTGNGTAPNQTIPSGPSAPPTALPSHKGSVTALAVSKDGKLASVADDGSVILWTVENGQIVQGVQTRDALRASVTLSGHTAAVLSAVYSPDGKHIVTASADYTARIWDAVTGNAITVLRGFDDAVNSAAFSPDGRRIVTASSDGTARIWDATTGKQITVLIGHEGVVNSAAFSPDGTRIVTGSSDRTARIWDATTGKQITVLSGHESVVNTNGRYQRRQWQ